MIAYLWRIYIIPDHMGRKLNWQLFCRMFTHQNVVAQFPVTIPFLLSGFRQGKKCHRRCHHVMFNQFDCLRSRWLFAGHTIERSKIRFRQITTTQKVLKYHNASGSTQPDEKGGQYQYVYLQKFFYLFFPCKRETRSSSRNKVTTFPSVSPTAIPSI